MSAMNTNLHVVIRWYYFLLPALVFTVFSIPFFHKIYITHFAADDGCCTMYIQNMSFKIKTVVVVLKIVICLLLSRPFLHF